jgi:hypothetical protein
MAHQTALTLLLDYYNDLVEKEGDKMTSYNVLQKVIRKAAELKQIEKEHIIKAVDSIQLVNRYYYKNGEISEDLMGQEISTDEERTYIGLSTNGIKYYNETYNK